MSVAKPDPGAACVENITPILNVKNVPLSIRYYVDVLGFKLDWTWGDEADFASVSRDGHAIMLCQDGQGHSGTWLWVGVDDIEPLFQDFSRAGVTFLEPPTNFPWACEMKVQDPDGHVLRFGSEPKARQDDRNGAV
jgi:catechol 2,3-dioxygenase-like lactoylglutathione lyase family enzyme